MSDTPFTKAQMYARIRQMEVENKDNLVEYQEEKPGAITQDNVNDVLEALRRRKGQ